MKTITTKSGQKVEIKWILGPLDNGQVLIDLVGDRLISEIAPVFENQESFRVDDDENPNKHDVYENYTMLTGVNRRKLNGVTRLTLEKGDEA